MRVSRTPRGTPHTTAPREQVRPVIRDEDYRRTLGNGWPTEPAEGDRGRQLEGRAEEIGPPAHERGGCNSSHNR